MGQSPSATSEKMQMSMKIEKMSPTFAMRRDGGKDWGDDKPHRRPDHSKPRNKRDYSQSRRLKEMSYVWA